MVSALRSHEPRSSYADFFNFKSWVRGNRLSSEQPGPISTRKF